MNAKSEEWKTPAHLPEKAWLFAARKHQGQLYPGTELPYLTHVGMVLLNLTTALEREPFLDTGFAKCCAILHDTVEDTDTTPAEIETEFGARVVAGVAALSKRAEKGDLAMADSLERIRKEPREVWLVKLADRISNLETRPTHWQPEKCMRYANEGEMILQALGSASSLLSALLEQRIAAWREALGTGGNASPL
jgi:(p)ppGpp synthase/HD superfamily hydrolase